MNLFRTLLLALSVLFLADMTLQAATTTVIPSLSFSGNIYLPRTKIKVGTGSFSLSSTGSFTAQATLLGRTYRAVGAVAEDGSFTATLTGKVGRTTLRLPVNGSLTQDAQGWLLTGSITVAGRAFPFSMRPPAGTVVGV